MSDLSLYQLDDIIWDDFDQSDDHIVPHPSSAHSSRNSCEGNIFKKHRPEAAPVLSNADEVFASDSICQGEEERETKASNMKRNMLEREHWSTAHDAVLSTASCDGDTIKDTLNLASDDSRVSSNCFKSSNVTSDLSFFNNDCEDKESSDLLYYGWPDIRNFEDVDRILRSCHSSFGLGVTGNDNGLGWFTPEGATGGAEEAIEMDFKFSCPEPAALKNILQDGDSPESNNKRSRYISESKEELKLKDQKKHPKHQNQTEQKEAGQCLGNDSSFYHIHDSESSGIQLSSVDNSDPVFTSIGIRQQKRKSKLDCFDYMQSNTSYPHPLYTHAPNQKTIKSENKDLLSPSIESSGDPSFQRTAAKVNEQKSQHHPHGVQPLFTANSRQMGMVFQASKSDLVSAHLSANELESQGDIEGVRKESSSSSELDEISLEATSFRQLQKVMEQLDLRTKLCIRDSLYRLARSAEQRHNASLSGSAADYKDTGGSLLADGTNKCSGFMGIESDTNPIDRSIAHLLFHRPSDSPNLPAPSPLKTNAMNHVSITSQEEAATESNNKITME